MYSYGLCTINWGSVAEYLQILAIAGTGIVAIIVASRQLTAFNSNTLIQNTLKVLDDFYRPVDVDGHTFSPLNGFTTVQNLVNTPELLRFNRIWTNIKNRMPVSEEDARFFMRSRSAATALANYFTLIKGLIDRKVVDEKLILEKVGMFAYDGFPSVKQISHPYWTLEDFRYIAERAKEMYPPAEDKFPAEIIILKN